jgi:hypothetical protein
MSLVSDGNLLPFRQINESDVLNYFALDATGLNGMLVAIQTGSQNPADSAGAYRSTAPNGVAFTNVGNYGYGATRKVRPAAVTDSIHNVLGVTLHTTAITDENGNPLVNQAHTKTIERGFVQTGWAVPIATRGLVRVKLANIVGTPFPGHAATIGAAGGFGVVNPVGNLPLLATGSNVVGKYLSFSGSAFGGYAEILLNCQN